jgi:uncharacterized membrane protein YqjE
MEKTGSQAGGQFGDYLYSSDPARERSFADIVKSIIANVQELIRAEVRLAKTELREEGGRAAAAGRNLAIAAVAGLMALLFVLLAVMYALALAMPLWASAAVVALALGATALVLYNKGKGEWQRFSPKPEKTVETVKENVEWIKTQTRS